MKMLTVLALSLVALSSTNVFAQGKTRAEVYQELIEARQNGLDFVSDASYPDVSPVFQGTVDYLKKRALAKAANGGNQASSANSTPGN